VLGYIKNTRLHSAYRFRSQNNVMLGDFNRRIRLNSEILMPEERRVEILQRQNKLFIKFYSRGILIAEPFQF
jgi:hypothetical protein